MFTIQITTNDHTQMYDITYEIEKIVKESKIQQGVCLLSVPHSTGCITINDAADPDASIDIIDALNKLVPRDDNYRQIEGNSAARLKASIIGFSESIIIEEGQLVLGTWEGIYFVEFDGPKHRTINVKLIEC